MGLSPTSGLGGAGLGGAGIGGAGISKGAAAPAYVGPLDLVPGAVVAYSVRALSTAYLGQPIFRLRRDSDDAELDFSADAVTGEAPSADIATWLGAADGFFVTLYDQSGNDHHMSQETAAMQPLYLANEQNGMPGASFPLDSQSYVLQSPDSTVTYPSGELSSFIVSSNIITLGVYGEVDYVEASTGSGVKLDLFKDPDRAGASFTEALAVQYRIWDGVAETGARNCKADGTNLVQATVYDSGTVSGSIAGQGFLFNATSVGEVSKALEVISYGSIINDANRLLVRQNQATFYGITLS